MDCLVRGMEPVPAVAVRLEQGAYRAGETVCGIAEVRIGAADRSVKRIVAKLVEDADDEVTRSEVTLRGTGVLPAGTVLTEVFELATPLDGSRDSLWTVDVEVVEDLGDGDEDSWTEFAEFEFVPRGEAGVGLIAENPAYGWDEVIRGKVRVLVGYQGLTFERIRLELSDNQSSDTREPAGVDLAGPGSLAAGTAAEYAFELKAPLFARHPCYYVLTAAVDLTDGDTVIASISLEALPSLAARTLAAAVVRTAPLDPDPKVEVDGAGQVVMSFVPTTAGSKTLDGVKLTVTDQGGQVSGVLEIDPQEHSLADVIKDLLGKDRVQHDLHFTREELVPDDAGRPPAMLLKSMERLLQPYAPPETEQGP